MKTLIVAEHNHTTIHSATLASVGAATKLANPIEIIVIGHNCAGAAKAAAAIAGVTKVWQADAPHFADFLAEEHSALLASIAKQYTHIILPSTTTGKNIAPRLAALLDISPVSDIIGVNSAHSFQRPIYAGNAIATVEVNAAIVILTVRTTAFEPASPTGGLAAIETVAVTPAIGKSQCVGREVSKSERPELTSAKIVVSGGRGVGSAENFKIIEALADKLGAAVGASRAAVDAGYVPNDYQVGQTGKIVAPNLYIAVGISGAIQHLAGMKESKVIVAINKDEEAPIMQVADYAVIGDLFAIVPALEKAL